MKENMRALSVNNVIAQSNGDIPFVYYSNSTTPGVYIHWDRQILNEGTIIATYDVLRSSTFDGTYESIVVLDFPINEYVDGGGNPSYYYKIAAYDDGDSLIYTTQPFVGDELLIMASLAYQIKDFLRVPIYDEEGIFNSLRTGCRWAYSNWNYWPRPQIRITGLQLTSTFTDATQVDSKIILSENSVITETVEDEENYIDGLKYKLDYHGAGYFLNENDEATPVQPYDSVTASYYVRLFSGSEMNDALNLALQTINGQPGAPKFPDVSSTPFYYEAGLVTGATYFLLRALLTRLTQRETRLLLQDPESGAYNAIDNLRESIRLYGEDWKEYQKSLPRAKYPRTSQIITPEFMMPGSRSRMFRQMWKGS